MNSRATSATDLLLSCAITSKVAVGVSVHVYLRVDQNETGAVGDGRDLHLVLAVVLWQFDTQVDAGVEGLAPLAFEEMRAGRGIAQLPADNPGPVHAEGDVDFARANFGIHCFEMSHLAIQP